MNYLTIGHTHSRRVAFWQDVLAAKGFRHQLISFQQIVGEKWPDISGTATLRITSPGEDFETYRLLLSLGGCPQAEGLSFEKGRIQFAQYWYKGWCILLDKIDNFLKRHPHIKVMNSPQAIRLAFHKATCQQWLAQQQIPTPQIFLPQLKNYEQLIDTLEQQKLHQVFIKPWHGSSASGVMAFRKSGNRQMLYTTIHLVQENGVRLYNHLQLQKYNDPQDIKTIIDEMIPHGLLVEQWIRKKTFRRKSVDLRIVVIRDTAVFVVPRMSPHFITNLHLGNEKGKIEALEVAWGSACIASAKKVAVQAVAAIPGLFYAGVDVAIDDYNEKPYVLEVNAFGDLLLNIHYKNKTTYEWEWEIFNDEL